MLFPWHAEAIADLRRHWSDGFTASEIATRLERFGKITRCAVIGKVRRLGLESRKPSGPGLAALPKRKRTQQPRQKSLPFILRPLAKQGKPLPAAPMPRQVHADVARVAFLDLESHHCRWPVGEPTQGFCGCPKVEGLSYCEAHAHRAFAVSMLAKPNPNHIPNLGITAARNAEEFLSEAVA
jgi:GcrA cell cycle regulator